MKKNVLFITYFFPPGASSGVFRPLKFVKYLKRGESWNPIVLSIDESYYSKSDFSLNEDVPEDLDIYRVASLQPLQDSSERYKKTYHQVHLPDSAVGGIMHFVLKGLEIINRQKIDLIFCTIPHPSIGMIGTILKGITGIPLIVDYRDGWTTNPMKPRSEEGRQINQYFEKSMLNSVNGVVTVDQRIKQDLIQIGCRSEIEVILNGFDREDFKDKRPYSFGKSSDDLVVSYCGYIYRDDVSAHEQMAEAIRIWNLQSNKGRTIKYYIAGLFQNPDDQHRLLSNEVVTYAGHLDYDSSLSFISSSDASVGVMTLDYSMAGKFYNLMFANQFIFALINPENEQIQHLLSDYSGKAFIPLHAPADEIVENIEKWFEHREADLSKSYMPEGYLNEYSRESQTRQLENFFDRITSIR